MKEYPKISIITPTYNRSEYLEETILSVLNQNYPNLEYIIVDGGSTDGTLEIIKKYESKLSYWISEPDNGMYHALQKGFEKSTGEIMAWLNSDDKYQAGAFYMVNQIFSSLPEVEWIIGMPAFYNDEGNCVKVSDGKRWSKSRLYIGDYKWIQQESVFWKRSLWERAGANINLNYKYAGDFELWCRFFKFASLHNVNTPLSGFRLHGHQLSLEYSDVYEAEAKGIYEKLLPLKNELKRFIIIKRLWVLRNFSIKSSLGIMKFIVLGLDKIIDQLHHFPNQIYYDFDAKIWKR